MWNQQFFQQFNPLLLSAIPQPPTIPPNQSTTELFVQPPTRQKPKRKTVSSSAEPKPKRGRPRKELGKEKSELTMNNKLEDFRRTLMEEKISPNRMKHVVNFVGGEETEKDPQPCNPSKIHNSAFQLATKDEKIELKAIEKHFDEGRDKFLAIITIIKKDSRLMKKLEHPFIKCINEFFRVFGTTTAEQADNESTYFFFSSLM